MEKKYWLVFIAFFLSGFAGLMTESLLAGILSGFVSSAFAGQVWVLVLFMTGMGLGAFLSETRIVFRNNPFRLYAFIEIFAALSLIFTAVTVNPLLSYYHSIAGSFGLLSDVFRFAVMVLLVLPPSLAMGMSFPLLFRGLNGYLVSRQKLASLLYGINILGGVLGLIFTTYWIRGTVDIRLGLLLAALILIIAGGIVFLMRFQSVTNKDEAFRIRQSSGSVFYYIAFFNGLVVFILEVCMLRMMVHITGSSFRSFDLMLAVFVTGLGFGAIFPAFRFFSKSSPYGLISWINIFIAITSLISILVFYFSFNIMAQAYQSLMPDTVSWIKYNLWQVFLSFIIMFFPAFFSGMILPVVFGKGSEAGTTKTGYLYAFNILGCITGALLAWLVLFPVTGSVGGVISVAVMTFLASWFIHKNWNRRLRMVISAMLLVLLTGSIYYHWSHKELYVSGVFRTANIKELPQILFREDGRTASVALTIDSGRLMSLIINGKADAAISLSENPATDEPVQILLGALPLAFHENPQNAAIIGLGSGLTAHVLLGDSSLRKVEIIEIEPAVIRASRNFGNRVSKSFFDKRSYILVKDAALHFYSAQNLYDLIVSEPSNPWVSGSSYLFTEDFYRQLKPGLRKNGIFVQWIQLYENDVAGLSAVMTAIGKVFKDYSVYYADDRDLLIVAGDTITETNQTRIFRMPDVVEDLRRIGVFGLADLTLRFIGRKAWMQPYFDETAIEIPKSSLYLTSLEMHSLYCRFFRREIFEMDAVANALTPLFEPSRMGLSRAVYPLAFRFHRPLEYDRIAWFYRYLFEQSGTGIYLKGQREEANVQNSFIHDAASWHRMALSAFAWAVCSEMDSLLPVFEWHANNLNISENVSSLMQFYQIKPLGNAMQMVDSAVVLMNDKSTLNPDIAAWVRLRCLYSLLQESKFKEFDVFWHNFCNADSDKVCFNFVKSIKNQQHQKLRK